MLRKRARLTNLVGAHGVTDTALSDILKSLQNDNLLHDVGGTSRRTLGKLREKLLGVITQYGPAIQSVDLPRSLGPNFVPQCPRGGRTASR